ncbi:methyltransferase [Stanieria cyanosphaera PCC 7437]|uniref:S-adenosyl-L-methionine-dependent methyltransferase n=1 Tax=Stanieria cyanosphaera (strain ATCC 29371 / PCC 7437) TaxID=111780 RepID=K9XV19_STAC7|nr:SAM-dependent methyltransferase [Stanieria cyanosphaera]AFZ35909.1 methyltransferase [Stanieria cyanosphaera PCC 7437]
MNSLSETAYLVAMYRAMESARPDALFQDPFASMLAGGQGKLLAEVFGNQKQAANIIAVRTYTFDRIIEQLLNSTEIDTVVNLGAGLDTRPYRLALPRSLCWVEVDLPEIISYKSQKLQQQQPLCSLERIELDLTNSELRNNLFTKINSKTNQVLVITEGLLSYLSEEQVNLLSEELRSQSHFRWWLFELIAASEIKLIKPSQTQKLFQQYFSNKLQFAPNNGLDFFSERGWKIAQFYSMWQESRRLKRGVFLAALLELLMRCFSKKYWQAINQKIGIVLLEKN